MSALTEKKKKTHTNKQELNGDKEEFFILFFLSFYQEPSESHSTSVTFPAACSTLPVGSVHYLCTLQSWPQGWASETAFLHALLLFKRNICIILPFPSREVRLATGGGRIPLLPLSASSTKLGICSASEHSVGSWPCCAQLCAGGQKLRSMARLGSPAMQKHGLPHGLIF